MVEQVDTFRMRYVIDAATPEEAQDIVEAEEVELQEFSQLFLGSHTSSVRQISKKEYLRMFDEDNDYLSEWYEYQKLQFINR